MAENRSAKLPQFESTEALVEFFETQDVGDYLEGMPEVEFEIDIQRKRYLVSIEESLMNKLMETAKRQHISVEMLINTWLQEKVSS